MTNREDIIKLAREAGFCTLLPSEHIDGTGGIYVGDDDITDSLKRFTALVAAAEREACAKVCEDSVPTYLKDGERWLKGKNGRPDVRLKEIAPNLEGAWEAEQLLKNGSVIESYSVQHQCAAAIRARGKA